jgi:hypothetical protein
MTRHNFTSWIMCALAAALICGSAPAFAGDRAHDNGFFLRLSGGIGGASAEMEDASGKNKVEGGTGDINLAIGGVLAKNFALHGTIWGFITSDPEVTFGSQTGTLNGDVDFSAYGAGVTYYFMPVNMYLSGSVGVGTLSMSANTPGGTLTGESDLGPAFELTLGKEWWVGTSWGLGLALAGGVFSVPDGSVDESWGGGHVALRFSATLN